MIKKKTKQGLIVSGSGPLTMSTAKSSQNFVLAEIVTAFSDKRKSKLFKLAKQEKEKNPSVAMFAILCWLYLESQRTIVPAIEVGPRSFRDDEMINKLAPASETEEALNLFRSLLPKDRKIDTSFFEKDPVDFFSELFVNLKKIRMEYEIQRFYPNSYYFHGGLEKWAFELKTSITQLYQVFLRDNLFSFFRPSPEDMGSEFLDRIMTFVYGKEANKNGGSNKIARLKAYQLFLVAFSANSAFPREVRERWSQRLGIWINIEQHIGLNPKKFEKNTALLKKYFPTLVTQVQDSLDQKGGFLDKTIEEKMSALKFREGKEKK